MDNDVQFVSTKASVEAVIHAPKRPKKFLASSDPEKDRILDKPLFSKEKKDSSDDSFGIIAHSPASKKAGGADRPSDMMNCPFCNRPFPPGLQRTAHFKSCQKMHGSGGGSLFAAQNDPQKERKSSRNSHTKAPPTQPKLFPAPPPRGPSRSSTHEPSSRATMTSTTLKPLTPVKTTSIEDLREHTPQFTRLPDPNERRKRRPRSFAVVEFAPRSCHCQVISAIQTRFVDAFKSKIQRKTEIDEPLTPRTDSQAKYQRRLFEKTNRYERLADDFSSLFDRGLGADLHITCNEGVIPAHKTILLARTRGLVGKEDTIRMEEPKEIITMWLRFIYTGRIEWSPGQEDSIVALAQKYGPESLLSCGRPPKREQLEVKSNVQAVISELVAECAAGPSTSGGSQLSSRINSILEETVDPEGRKVLEDTICGILDGTNPIDGEDPMQGINLSLSSPRSKGAECIVLDETVEAAEPRLVEPPSKENRLLAAADTAVKATGPEEVVPGSPDLFETSSEGSEESAKSWHMTPLYISYTTSEEDHMERQQPTKRESEAKSGEEEKQAATMEADEKPLGSNFEEMLEEYPMEEPVDYGCWDMVDNYEAPLVDTSPVPNEKMESTIPRSASSSVVINDTPKSIRRRSSLVKTNFSKNSKIVEDSFDLTPELVAIPQSRLAVPGPSRALDQPLAHSTPVQPATKKLKFASNVKIVKTEAITPMPNYEAMDEARLKIELAANGLRAMGRKRAIAKLTEIYESTHPEVDPDTPTIRPLDRALPGVREETAEEREIRRKLPRRPLFVHPADPKKTPTKTAPSPVASSESSPSSEQDELGNKTLNSDADEPAEESMLDDPASLPKNLDEMQTVFLTWLRKKENDHLHNHMLSLQPVLIDELHMKTSKADDPVCAIPKKALASILDRLAATFSLPPKNMGRRGGGGGHKKRK